MSLRNVNVAPTEWEAASNVFAEYEYEQWNYVGVFFIFTSGLPTN